VVVTGMRVKTLAWAPNWPALPLMMALAQLIDASGISTS
jgi:hypothetical protein